MIDYSVFDYNQKTGSMRWAERTSNRINIGDEVGSLSDEGYLITSVAGVLFRVHRIAWEIVNGPIPDGKVIDHINHIRTDNRICNLRVVDHLENQRNRVVNKNNSSGFLGVSWD